MVAAEEAVAKRVRRIQRLENETSMKNEIDELLGKFGFNVKLWYSNNKKIGQFVKSKSFLVANGI